MTDCSEGGDREKWNRRYRGSRVGTFRDEPAEWLVRHRSLLLAQPKGRALDIASGGGRNAFCLAELGFVVDAWDISDVAIERVAAEAARRDLEILARQCDLTEVAIPVQTFEVVVNFNYLERSLFEALANALVPGGLLVFESFIDEHATVVGKPMNPRYLLEPDELRDAFSSLQVIDYREDVKEAPKGDTRAVARLVARRPR